MENIFNPAYRQNYIAGYSDGLNPTMQLATSYLNDNAFSSGFMYGRMDYERMNGSISEGIPKKIVTIKVLEEFLLAGMLGLEIDAEGYTTHQTEVIAKWYESGTEKYDADDNIYLLAILEYIGIEVH
jgi:hypothetical protein